ncbi:MAG: hypothetical protein IJS17_00340 [Clostridia bacterium]|nr:hypothetical protein [Clostridia bacterium]
MKILFAAPDRDLVKCYQNLLSNDEVSVQTAYDGAQALTKLSEERFDLLIVSQDIPRISAREIVNFCNKNEILVIVLMMESVRLKTLMDEVLANAYLQLPFTPEELESVISGVEEKKAVGENVSEDEFNLDIENFSVNGVRLTSNEIDVLIKLHKGEFVIGEKDMLYIESLKSKLSLTGGKERIRYEKNNGYKWVTKNEQS